MKYWSTEVEVADLIISDLVTSEAGLEIINKLPIKIKRVDAVTTAVV
jgi:hypothetical protein